MRQFKHLSNKQIILKCVDIPFSHKDKIGKTVGSENQRTIGPVNAHLIYGPSKSTKHTKPGKKTMSRNDLDLQYSFSFIF